MGFIESGTTIEVKSFLTRRGRELYFLGDDKDIIVTGFSLGDSDTNYVIASNDRLLEDRKNYLDNGTVPDITGDYEGCISSMVGQIKYLLNKSTTPKGTVVSQFCQPPHTLIQEISNGDGTTYFTAIQNSIQCGFVFKSKPFSKTFKKINCVKDSEAINNPIGQDYVVSTSLGQFTGLTQDIADQLALDYINNNGQTIANTNGSCLFGNTYQEMTFYRQGCQYGSNPYIVTALENTQFSNISTLDANNKAILYLNSNGQTIANANGTCKTIIGYDFIRTIAFKSIYGGTNGNFNVPQDYIISKNIPYNNNFINNQILTRFSLGNNIFNRESTTFNEIIGYITPNGSPKTVTLLPNNYLNIPQTFQVNYPSFLNDEDVRIYLQIGVEHDIPNPLSTDKHAPNDFFSMLFNNGTVTDNLGNSININITDITRTDYDNGYRNQGIYTIFFGYKNPNKYNINTLTLNFDTYLKYINVNNLGFQPIYQRLLFYHDFVLAVNKPIIG
jgi:hypothetical protein